MNTETPLKHTDTAYLHSDITDIASGSFYRSYNGLGFGFLESVYRNALARELAKAGVNFEREVPIDVWYDGALVGHFKADFVLEGRVILEVKASQMLCEADRKQLLNYLRARMSRSGCCFTTGRSPPSSVCSTRTIGRFWVRRSMRTEAH